jgi:hypothetical protein
VITFIKTRSQKSRTEQLDFMKFQSTAAAPIVGKDHRLWEATTEDCFSTRIIILFDEVAQRRKENSFMTEKRSTWRN